ALKQLGWVEGRNVRFDIRWGEGRATETRRHSVELAALAPDIIFASGIAPLQSLLRETRTIPIVFCNLADPVSAGLVNSLARPGGNATGFTQFEYTSIIITPPAVRNSPQRLDCVAGHIGFE